MEISIMPELCEKGVGKVSWYSKTTKRLSGAQSILHEISHAIRCIRIIGNLKDASLYKEWI
jgi:hypothetical protein